MSTTLGGMTATRVVETLDEIENSALSKQSPTEPIEGRMPASRQRRPKAIEVYWQP